MNPFQIGERVRIRKTTDYDFAGFVGEVVLTRASACDVKITYPLDDSDALGTFIGVFPIKDVEPSPEDSMSHPST